MRLARKLAGDPVVAERIVSSATESDSRSISTAAIYSAWQRERARVVTPWPRVEAI